MKKVLVISISILILMCSLTLFKPNNNQSLKEVKLKEENNDLIGIYIKQENNTYSRSKTVPTEGYVLNEDESYCKTPTKAEEKINKIINYDNETKTLTVKSLNDINTKCFLYFDKELTAKDTLAALGIDYSNVQDQPSDFNKTACAAGTNRETHTGTINCDTTDTGLFKGTEKINEVEKETYYYRGTVNNNWVSFANNWWRIIRINGNGSIRLIYSGSKKPNGDGKWADKTDSQLSSTSAFNGTYSDNRYVGYMYGTSTSDYKSTHTNTNQSTIKGILDGWYSSNMTTFTEKLDGSAGFCNDREPYDGSGTDSTVDKNNYGFGTKATYYGPYIRTEVKHIPSFNCTQSKNDLFTTGSEQGEGNGKLDYPVGLITADEVEFAGGKNSNNYGYWLYTGQYYWTMSPYYFSPSTYPARVFYVDSSGYLSNYDVGSARGVRPVINLKAGTKLTYTNKNTAGTLNDPYVVS